MKSIVNRLLFIILIFHGSVAAGQNEKGADTTRTEQTTSNANASRQVEMADKMRSEGKIYVVVAVILVVLTGLIVYIFSVDRKLTRIEKQLHEKR